MSRWLWFMVCVVIGFVIAMLLSGCEPALTEETASDIDPAGAPANLYPELKKEQE